MLLPEAEQIVELSKTLEHQSEQVDRAQSEITKLKRERRLIKTGGTSDYPANLEVCFPAFSPQVKRIDRLTCLPCSSLLSSGS